MTDTKKAAPRKRRAVSKARLYKEIVTSVEEHFSGDDGVTVEHLLDALKDDIVREALKT